MKKEKRSLKSALCLILAVACLFACFVVPASATTTISPSDDQFKAAENPKYSNSSENISAAISTSYEMDIYHYEAPCEGYYAIYTTGYTDTVGAVYEHKNFLWWTTSYDRVAYGDDDCMIGNPFNCSMVVHMERGEDYYICVRAYSNTTGDYHLVIEPNEDKYETTRGGIWNCDYVDMATLNKSVQTTKKQYLTKTQALLNYLWLDDVKCIDDTGTEIDFDLIKTTYNKDTAEAIDLANLYLGILTSGASSGLSITVTFLGALISEVYSATTDSIDELKDEFEIKCGIEKTAVSINGSSGTVLYTIQNGILKKTRFAIITFTEYYANNDTILTGERYCYGHWN